MSNICVAESQMQFILQENETFLIENSKFVSSLNDYSKVEFVICRDNKLVFIEAKTTLEDKSGQIQAVVKKFKNSLEVVLSLTLRHSYKELPEEFKKIKWSKNEIFFYLIIKKYPDDKIVLLNNAIKSKLSAFCKCWKINQKHIKVLGEEQAKKLDIIQ